jgi:hypothetical protein
MDLVEREVAKENLVIFEGAGGKTERPGEIRGETA